MGGGPGRSELKTPLAKNCGYVTLASQHVILRPLVAPAGRISLALSVQVGSSPALGSRRKNTGVNESKFTLSEVPAPGRACDRFEAQTRTDHDPSRPRAGRIMIMIMPVIIPQTDTADRSRRPARAYHHIGPGPPPRGGLDRTLSISTSAPR